MGNVVIDMSMSLDGYIAAPNDTPEQGLGEDGMRLHNWMFDDPAVFDEVFGNLVEDTGAVIMGRRSYDNSIEAWGGQGPLGEVPCFVVTHRPIEGAGPVFTVVTDGIESALAKAQEVAGDKRIGLMGANLDQQFLAAGLVDEIRIHDSPRKPAPRVSLASLGRRGPSHAPPSRQGGAVQRPSLRTPALYAAAASHRVLGCASPPDFSCP